MTKRDQICWAQLHRLPCQVTASQCHGKHTATGALYRHMQGRIGGEEGVGRGFGGGRGGEGVGEELPRPPMVSGLRGSLCSARRAHCALLLDYVPPKEPPSTPLGNALRNK